MRKVNFSGAFAMSTASGCLWFLAVTPFDFSGLAWLAAVPMFWAIEHAGNYRRALFLGWWAGVVETGGGFYWLIDVMQRFADFPWLGAAAVFFVFCATRAVIFLLFTAVVRWIRDRSRIPMTLLAPVAMVSCELLVPQLFPCGQWISQAWNPLVIQITELTGPLGVTALLMLVNGALYDCWLDPRRAVRPALAAAVLLSAALVFGAVRMHQVDAAIAAAPRLKIGLVQPNFAYTIDGEFSRDEALRQLTALQEQSRRLEKAGAQLVVWSEGSYPVTVPRDFSEDFPAESLGMIRRGIGVPVIIGADMYDAKRDDAFNSAIMIGRDGKVAGLYDKVRLLAFGEYIPLVDEFPWLRKFLPEGAGRFKAGAGPLLLTLREPGQPDWRLGPVICYEDLLEGFLRGVGALHPNVLVNLTSDSWFGAQAEPWEHLALSVFASVELRVSLVRAVNSGVSAIIDPNGRVLQKSYADDPYRDPRAADGILVTAPAMAGGHTVFVVIGNAFGYACLLATLCCLVIATKRGRSSRFRVEN